MTGAVLKKLTIFAPSAMLLVMAYLAVPHINALSPPQHELALISPYLLIATGIVLSLAFSRGRVFFILLLLAGFYWSYRTYLQQGLESFPSRVVFQFLCLSIPFNITVFCYLREKGVFTLAGRMRLGFLALQLAMVVWVIRYRQDYDQMLPFFTRDFVQIPLLSTMAVSQFALFMTIICFFIILWRVIRRKSPIDSGLLGCLVAVFLAFNTIASADLPLVFIGAAALILAVSILQDTHNMAFRDDLTGLPSRRALNEQMLALGRHYVIAMLDVDHFKNFNDTHGHDVGDQVLKMVAKRMAAVKGGGRAFRYGGEEFTIVFTRRKMAEAIPFLEEVRKNIAAYEMIIRGEDRPKKAEEGKKNRSTGRSDRKVSVTISIGIAESTDSMRTADEVIKAADKALYRAKNKGRNQLSK